MRNGPGRLSTETAYGDLDDCLMSERVREAPSEGTHGTQ